MHRKNTTVVATLCASVAISAMVSSAAQAASVNYALSSAGASFVSATSAIGIGNGTVMQNDLLTTTPTSWLCDGDTRYIFGANDPNGTIEINLGQVRQINSITTSVDLPSMGDRPVIGPVSIEVSTNGSSWTSFGSSVTITNAQTNPLLTFSGVNQGVQYIEYIYGPTGSYYGTGGAAINSISASEVSPVPLPGALPLFGSVLIGIGALARRRTVKTVHKERTV